MTKVSGRELWSRAKVLHHQAHHLPRCSLIRGNKRGRMEWKESRAVLNSLMTSKEVEVPQYKPEKDNRVKSHF